MRDKAPWYTKDDPAWLISIENIIVVAGFIGLAICFFVPFFVR